MKFSTLLSVIVFAAVLPLHAQEYLVSGKVTNTEKLPVVSAHVHINNLPVAVTDSTGHFVIKLAANTYLMSVSHIEYEEYTNMVNVSGAMSFEINLNKRIVQFEEITIYGLRLAPDAPITFTEISGEALNEVNFGQDMPYLLQNTVSAIATSDAGNGVGYTGIRIRGSDATRINVTLNGIPFNDAESHQAYWVDIPDIASSAGSVQIQRGVGTSTNGVGAFGASINLFTNELHESPFASAEISAGSFNLLRTTAHFGTGRLHKNWFVEGRISYTNSDGYIDRSFADLRSLFLTFAYDHKNYRSVINVISGKEKTYQSWAGVPKDSLETNPTYNPYTYENQTDNYLQNHFQWHHHFFLRNNSLLNISMNLTLGDGYFEQLEGDADFISFGFLPIAINDTIITTADLITQKWLDNSFYGLIADYNIYLGEYSKLILGGGFFQYQGEHYGKIIWSEYGFLIPINYTYYSNNAVKNDGNIFVQWRWTGSKKWSFLADVQYRYIDYNFLGYDDELNNVQQNITYQFVNPKLNLGFAVSDILQLYGCIAFTSKEPNRDDFVNSSTQTRPNPEHLTDFELGGRLHMNGWNFTPNVYFMWYQDQLILDGSINDVGAYTRVNVPQSYRAGMEIILQKEFASSLTLTVNLTVSRNIIRNYTEYIDNWDTGGQYEIFYNKTNISFSPSYIGYLGLEYDLMNSINNQNKNSDLLLRFNSKYVSSQFLDNSSDISRSLSHYLLNDLSLTYSLPVNSKSELSISFLVTNVLNIAYISNGWTYRYQLNNEQNDMIGYYPQAGRAFYIKSIIQL